MLYCSYIFICLFFNCNFITFYLGLGARVIGDWGLGIGDCAQSPTPNPQSPIPNPQSPIPKNKKSIYLLININNLN